MSQFFIYALGCKVNTYELESIKESLIALGLQQTFDVTQADYILLNTCCVTNTAQSKSRQKISSFQKANPNAILIVMGCYAQGFEKEVQEHFHVQLLVGTKNRHQIVDYISKLEKESQISLVEDVLNYHVYENLKVSHYSENTRAFLKIQDGCNNFCSYCIIPYVRGPIKSRDVKDVLEEAKTLLKNGYKEIVLTGIHTGSYGKDLNDMNFSDLVEKLLQLDGLYRLRISSIEESEIDDKLIYLLKTSPILAKHLHIPLQAGSDAILKLMNRKYDAQTYLQKIQKIQHEIPQIAISTDVIVGFPNETEDDFLKSVEMCKTIGFSKIHVFPYSSRNQTPAAKMKEQIHGSIKKERVKTLTALSDTLMQRYNQQFVNQEVEMLIETIDQDIAYGHTSQFIYVQCKIDTKKVFKNDIIKVRLIQIHQDHMIASWEESK